MSRCRQWQIGNQRRRAWTQKMKGHRFGIHYECLSHANHLAQNYASRQHYEHTTNDYRQNRKYLIRKVNLIIALACGGASAHITYANALHPDIRLIRIIVKSIIVGLMETRSGRTSHAHVARECQRNGKHAQSPFLINMNIWTVLDRMRPIAHLIQSSEERWQTADI